MAYLVHYGILGMKWGVRRYQNRDGTLTREGKERYGAHVEQVSERALKRQIQASDRSGRERKAKQFAEKKVVEAYKKADKTKEGRDYNNMIKLLSATNAEVKRYYGEKAEMVIDKKTAREINEITEKYMKTAQRFIDENRDEYAGLMLQDLGYDDTETGRKYISKVMADM